MLVILSVYFAELYLHQTHTLDSIRFVEEKIVRLIQIFQHVFLRALLHNRRQLEHITNEDYLFTSEWHIVPECLAHGVINGIHYIASYH